MQAPPARLAAPSAVASLPENLSASEVRLALDPVKAPARACGPAHGATPGEKIVVKLSIAGSTGLVTSAIVLGERGGTPLGDCVANAFARAVFPRFAKPSIGVQFPIRMPE